MQVRAGYRAAEVSNAWWRRWQWCPERTLFLGGVVPACAGEAERAIDSVQRALRVGPIDRLAFARHQALAVGHFLRGRYEEAANAARRAAELQRVKISPPRNRVVSKGRRHRSRKSHADRMVLSCT
jgi:tetratricopeptide (TPR) repeat protein